MRGKSAISLIGLLFFSAGLWGGTPCSSQLGDCSYYLCVDHELINCGPEGYAQGYGYKFCQAFSETNFIRYPRPYLDAVWPADANRWRDQVRSCLQVRLEEEFSVSNLSSCAELRKMAFKSHPQCYAEGEQSFCDLPPENLLQIAGLLGLRHILWSVESAIQIRTTAAICADHTAARLELITDPIIQAQLKVNLVSWRLLSSDQALGLEDVWAFSKEN